MEYAQKLASISQKVMCWVLISSQDSRDNKSIADWWVRGSGSCVLPNARCIGFKHSTVLPTHSDEIITLWTLRLSNLLGWTSTSCGQAIAQEPLSHAATVGTSNSHDFVHHRTSKPNNNVIWKGTTQGVYPWQKTIIAFLPHP
ncbi:hypothetical protein [Pseudanabaena mucicola]|uniref:hypothetical protein n=1 Tax=Pseudanabaena mucicola TaxID=71190 RepID=UPI002574B892|nr:hypothetical protein [Pseudanabaena mucicola]